MLWLLAFMTNVLLTVKLCPLHLHFPRWSLFSSADRVGAWTPPQLIRGCLSSFFLENNLGVAP